MQSPFTLPKHADRKERYPASAPAMREKWVKSLLVIITTILYLSIFVIFYDTYGKGFAALGILPVCVIGWFYGLRGGIVGGLIIPHISYLLMNILEGYSFLKFISAGGAIGGILGHILIGGVTGRLSDLSRQVKLELAERKKVEETLRKTSQALLSIFQSSPVAIIVLDTLERVSMWNPAAELIFGWSEEDVLGAPLPFLKYEAAAAWRSNLHALYEGVPVMGAEFRQQRADGTVVDIALYAAPLLDQSGAVTSVLTLLADITENRRLQKEVTLISGREQQRIGEDLHDGLGQVLTGVTFMSRVLQKKLADQALAEAEQAAEITHLVNEAISQTRNLSRVLYPVTLESEGLAVALDELAASTESLYGIPCSSQTSPAANIRDKNIAIHLYRIVQEAVNNAIRHAKPSRIAISFDAVKDKCILTVTDNGAGFDDSREISTGMGIKLMQYRARMLDATLSIQGEPDEGTVLTVAFKKT